MQAGGAEYRLLIYQYAVRPLLRLLRQPRGNAELGRQAGLLTEGEAVQLAEGAFRGLKAVVAKVLPSKMRVRILLEFLGRQTSVELNTDGVVREGDQRRSAFR